MLERVRIVLVGTSHPGNIGAAARAAHTMGMGGMALVAPRTEPKSPEAMARAAGAAEMLRAAPVHETLAQAVGECTLVAGTSARAREMSLPLLTPGQLAGRACAELREQEGAQVALVFGREDRGLDNAEMGLCQFHSMIDANPGYSSLNLAMAVQIYCHEMRVAWRRGEADSQGGGAHEEAGQEKDRGRAKGARGGKKPAPATAAQIDALVRHLESTLQALDFYGQAGPRQVPMRLRRMVQRLRPDSIEVGILRGALGRLDLWLREPGREGPQGRERGKGGKGRQGQEGPNG